MKTILVIDGQGGRMGALLIEKLKNLSVTDTILAVGTNAMATSAMLKAGAESGATGENPCVVCASRADIIAGPIGIVIPDSLLGEITEKMASAVGKANAKRVLIPMTKCDNIVVGVGEKTAAALITEAAETIKSLL